MTAAPLSPRLRRGRSEAPRRVWDRGEPRWGSGDNVDQVGNRIAVAALAGPSWCAPFQNGSFEQGPPNPCNTFNIPANDTRITGWTVSVGNIDWESGPPCGWNPSAGNNSLDLVGTGGIGGIRQTFDTIPGVSYRVSFDLAGNYGHPPAVKPLAVTINGVTTNFTFDTTGRGATDMGWTTKTVTFVADSTSSTIDFVSDVTPSGGTLDAGAALDNVSIAPINLTAAPLDWAQWAAAALLALAGLLLLQRKKATALR